MPETAPNDSIGPSDGAPQKPATPGSGFPFRKRRVLFVAVLVLIGCAILWKGWLQEPTQLHYWRSGSDAEASALVNRMLQANKPWLEPKPVAATYSLRQEWSWHLLLRPPNPFKIRMPREGKETKDFGPFSVLPTPAERVEPTYGFAAISGALSNPAVTQERLRLGATLWTPLHAMNIDSNSYKVKMVGKALWRFRTVTAVDVFFDNGIQCRIGMGPHNHGSNDGFAWYYGVQEARIFINPKTATPLLLITYPCPPYSKYDPKRATTWEFGSKFFHLDNGYAPQSLEWHSHDIYRGDFWDGLNFQAVDGTWIFRDGLMRSGHLFSKDPNLRLRQRLSEHVVTSKFRLIDLTIRNTDEMPLK